MVTISIQSDRVVGLSPTAWAVMLVTFRALGFAFVGGLLTLVERWSVQEEFSQRHLIPFMTLYFIWTKRAYLSPLVV